MTASASADRPLPGSATGRRPHDDDLAERIGAVVRAASRLRGVAEVTPVITSRTLDGMLGARVHAKAENLQRTGAFKFRGAYNAVSALAPADRARGVFTYSSGNHAQAVALAARLHRVPATILMPRDAPAIKVAATRGYDAEVITYDRYREDREALGRRLAAERGVALIPPYDHDDVIAGQGTATLELVGQCPARLDLLVVPVGGGGLIAGSAVVAASQDPPVEVVGVEPALRTVARDALDRGAPVTGPIVHTVADGQQTASVGARPFAVMARHVQAVVGVSDASLVAALVFAHERLKLVLEPSGAAALAAVLDGTIDVTGRSVGLILSGGNLGVERFRELTSAPANERDAPALS